MRGIAAKTAAILSATLLAATGVRVTTQNWKQLPVAPSSHSTVGATAAMIRNLKVIEREQNKRNGGKGRKKGFALLQQRMLQRIGAGAAHCTDAKRTDIVKVRRKRLRVL
jgi:hypothetical protein